MIISTRHKFIFLANPRCASTSICDLLTREYGGVQLGLQHDVHPDRQLYEGMFTWMVVRDPLDRLISIYEHIRKGGCGILWQEKCQTDAEFLEFYTKRRKNPNVLFWSQKKFMESRPVEIDQFVLYEEFHLPGNHPTWYNEPTPLRWMRSANNTLTYIDLFKLPHLNSAPRQPRKYFVGFDDIVNSILDEDRKEFGYA